MADGRPCKIWGTCLAGRLEAGLMDGREMGYGSLSITGRLWPVRRGTSVANWSGWPALCCRLAGWVGTGKRGERAGPEVKNSAATTVGATWGQGVWRPVWNLEPRSTAQQGDRPPTTDHNHELISGFPRQRALYHVFVFWERQEATSAGESVPHCPPLQIATCP